MTASTTRIATVVSARSASNRLPRKALLGLGGVPMIQFLLDRIRGAKEAGDLIFATTTRSDDDALAHLVASLGVPVHRGADADVVGRHLEVAERFSLARIVRVTGDCPFVDAASLDCCVRQAAQHPDAHLLSTKGVFPRGIDYELFDVATLKSEWAKMDDAEREHLTLRLYREDLGFRVVRFQAPQAWTHSSASFMVDTRADYDAATALVERLGKNFSIDES